MHLLRTRPGGYAEGEGVARIEQSPAPLVILSAADTDLSLLADAAAELPAEYPNIRLANLTHLRQHASVDLYVDDVLRHAKVIVAALLGGVSYWQYGVDQLVSLAKRHELELVLVPGDDNPDPELTRLSSVAPETGRRIWRYLREGGPGNARALFDFIARELFDLPVEYANPKPLPRVVVYHPDCAVGSLEHWRESWEPQSPVAAVLFYRAHLQSGNTAVFEALCGALSEAGLNPLPIALSSLKETPCHEMVELLLARSEARLIVNTTGFSLSSTDAPRARPFSRDVPVLQVILAGANEEDWRAGTQGLSPRDIAMNVALPEVDGRIVSRAVSFKGLLRRCSRTETDVAAYRAVPDRVRFVAALAANWVRLATKANAEKRIALVLANYPTRDGRIGNGVGLDTPESVVRILAALGEQGYAVGEPPASGSELMASLLTNFTNDPGLRDLKVAEACLSLDDYEHWFSSLPEISRRQVNERWGPPGDDPTLRDGVFPIPGKFFGQVFLGLQPPRGYHLDLAATYHDPDLVPPHAYLAFYCWLRTAYGADAVAHVGKHGNLEWLPGKGIALSASCWPEAALGPTPHVYPFIVNDPGEGAQAKRRAGAVVIDHLVPPLTRAETYGPLRELERLVDEYYEALNVDPRRSAVLRREILEQAGEVNLISEVATPRPDASSDSDDALLVRVDAYLCELKESQIRDGLHVFGESPRDQLRLDTLLALARLPQGDGTGENASLLRALAAGYGFQDFDPLDCEMAAPWSGPRPKDLAALGEDPWRSQGDTRERLELKARELLAEPAGASTADGAVESVLARIRTRVAPALDACGEREIGNLLTAFEGRFVPAGPSGAPSRGRLEVLPTGRNFYSVDVRSIPTMTAWRLGFKSASLLIERHLQEHGAFPQFVGISVWGTATMRTGGDDIAQAFALLGVRPVWVPGSNRVTDFEIIPAEALGRPRIDVMLRVSGFFRDAFSNVLRMFDAAVQALVELDEPAADNPIRARVRAEAAALTRTGLAASEARRHAGWRVFGSKPGAYGAGLQGLMDERCWDEQTDLADAYVSWGGYAYGESDTGTAAHDAFRSQLAAVEVVLQNQDNREHDILDSDDYYQFQGGMTAAVTALGGTRPAVYHGDHALPEAPRIRTLKEEIDRVVRSRVVNPKWIDGVRRHGYKGAFEMAATVDYLFAYDATTGVVSDYQYAMVSDAYLFDPASREFLKAHNPDALREMSERLLEATQRGLWAEPGPRLQQLEELLLELDQGLEA